MQISLQEKFVLTYTEIWSLRKFNLSPYNYEMVLVKYVPIYVIHIYLGCKMKLRLLSLVNILIRNRLIVLTNKGHKNTNINPVNSQE